jgi:hypothetical protein
VEWDEEGQGCELSYYPSFKIKCIYVGVIKTKETFSVGCNARRLWRYQRGNQNPYIEEEQTTQWPKDKVQKDKQRSTKHTYKTEDRVTRTPLKTRGELRRSGRVDITFQLIMPWKKKKKIWKTKHMLIKRK